MSTEKLTIVIAILLFATALSKAPNALFKSIRRLIPYVMLFVIILKLPEILVLLEQVVNTVWPAFVALVQKSSETLADMLVTISR